MSVSESEIIENQKKSKSILIADDENAITRIVTYVIQKLGNTIFTAKNGEEAIKIYEEEKPDLVLLDIRMPKMNGCETFLKIKEINPNANIVFMTAYSGDGCIQEIIKKYNPVILEKPFNTEDIESAVFSTI